MYLIAVSNFLFSFKLSNIAIYDLLASILFAHTNTCLLVVSLVSFTVANPLIIFAVMHSSFLQLIYCSFSLLSFSLHLHSVPFSLPIHSYTVSLLCLYSLQSWRDKIVSFCCNLIFFTQCFQYPFYCLEQFLSCICHTVYMNLNPSLSNQLFTIGIFLHHSSHNIWLG